MSLFLVLLGGDLTVTARLRDQVAGARVIAADSGIRHARALQVKPELWVGDFDSASAGLVDDHADIPRQTYPHEKDLSDGEIAVGKAAELGARRIVLAGAFGGTRTDHVHFHMAASVALAPRFDQLVMSSGNEEAVPLIENTPFSTDIPDGTPFSILPFSDLHGLTLSGAKWPLRDADVRFGSSLTLSNVKSGDLSVLLKKGRALFYARHRPLQAR